MLRFPKRRHPVASDTIDAPCRLDDAGWADGLRFFAPQAVPEILLRCGHYRTVSYVAGCLDLALEPWAARFPECGTP
ncbi:hypothetical protein [Streptomyces sp. NPDC001781]